MYKSKQHQGSIIRIVFTAIGLSPGGSGYFTCIQNIKPVTNKFKSGGLHEKHVVATWNLGSLLSICFSAQENQERQTCVEVGKVK